MNSLKAVYPGPGSDIVRVQTVAMPVAACDLGKVIEAFSGKGKEFSRRTIGLLLAKVALAMRFLIRINTIYNDVNSHNVFVGWDGDIKVRRVLRTCVTY